MKAVSERPEFIVRYPFMALEDDPDRTICFCHNVSYAELVKAIREGNLTLHDIQAQTRASTGCGGCECDVLEILEAELAKLKA